MAARARRVSPRARCTLRCECIVTSGTTTTDWSSCLKMGSDQAPRFKPFKRGVDRAGSHFALQRLLHAAKNRASVSLGSQTEDRQQNRLLESAQQIQPCLHCRHGSRIVNKKYATAIGRIFTELLRSSRPRTSFGIAPNPDPSAREPGGRRWQASGFHSRKACRHNFGRGSGPHPCTAPLLS